MERRRFTREFKLEAVRLIKERGVSYAQVSHDLRALSEKTESQDSHAGTNRIQRSCWNGGQHVWRNRIRRICVRASLGRDRMAPLSRKLRSNLE